MEQQHLVQVATPPSLLHNDDDGFGRRTFKTFDILYNGSVVSDKDYFKCDMMILIRTPNVDCIGGESRNSSSGNPQQDSVYTSGSSSGGDDNDPRKFFVGKLRRFEFQFQVQLKRVPVGRVYFACEIENEVKMRVIQRAFVGIAMAFVKSTKCLPLR